MNCTDQGLMIEYLSVCPLSLPYGRKFQPRYTLGTGRDAVRFSHHENSLPAFSFCSFSYGSPHRVSDWLFSKSAEMVLGTCNAPRKKQRWIRKTVDPLGRRAIQRTPVVLSKRIGHSRKEPPSEARQNRSVERTVWVHPCVCL